MKDFKALGLQKRFDGVVALKTVDVEFEGPKICGLVGANGSGKTTFARLCCGFYHADCGEIFVNGERVDIKKPEDALRYRIVLAHQNLSLIPDLSVWENIKLGREARKGFWLDDKFDKEHAKEILNELAPGEIAIEMKIRDLIPAHKQIVEIAKALSQDPELLILDEPTAALEITHVKLLFRKIKKLKENDTSVIFVSHRLWEITEICDVVFAFRNGEYVGSLDFAKQPRDEELIIPFVTGQNVKYEKKTRKNDYLNEGPDGRDYLILENVNYGNKVKNISLSVKKGEIIGIGGLSGQGQEELIMLLAGALKNTGGLIKMGGEVLKMNHPVHAVKRGIFLVPGDRNVDGLFNSHDVFTNGIFPRFSLNKEKFLLNFRKLYDIINEIIIKVELKPQNSKNVVKKLSGGNQQKIVFGRWLQFKPAVLLLNDPAKGIDIQAKDSLYTLARGLSNDGTIVVLYSSSNEELIENCDRVFVMFEGEIVDEFENQNLSDDNLIKSSLRVKGDMNE